jgi:hypothetical protein
MLPHGPSCLSGPVTRTRRWWSRSPSDDSRTLWPDRGADTMHPPANERPAEDRPIRTELVERIRREIAEGTYDTPDKWEAALDRLLRRIEPGEDA